MTKTDLIDRLTETLQLPRGRVERIVECVFGDMVDALRDGRGLEIRGFGSFSVRAYRPYEGRNPRTGDTVRVQAKRLPYFKVGKELKERINASRPAPAGDPPASETPPRTTLA